MQDRHNNLTSTKTIRQSATRGMLKLSPTPLFTLWSSNGDWPAGDNTKQGGYRVTPVRRKLFFKRIKLLT